MKHRKHFNLCGVGTLLLSLLVISCGPQSIPIPNNHDSGGNGGKFEKPQGLTASHGKKGAIVLNWTGDSASSQYYVYGTENPFGEESDSFVRIGETKGAESSFVYNCEDGKTVYFKVMAVSFGGVTSEFSRIVCGSTLAKPVITNISVSEQSTSEVKATWWMVNCSDETYIQNLNYEVLWYKNDATQEDGSIVVDGKENSCTISGLDASTKYWFEIKAFTGEKDFIASDRVDSETAKRTTPQAPQNFTVEKGVSQNAVAVSWTLPSLVDLKTGNLYSPRPVYFSIQRKLEGEADSKFRTISNYIGTVKSSSSVVKENDWEINFDCIAETSTSENLFVSSESRTVNSTFDVNYPNYITETKLTYLDKNVERGKKYVYRVQSFMDDSIDVKSSETSISYGSGWLINVPSISASASWIRDESNAITGLSIRMKSDFEDFGESYKYFVTQTITPEAGAVIPEGTVLDETIISGFENIDSINNYYVHLYFGDENKTGISSAQAAVDIGYYNYGLYVADSSVLDIEDFENNNLFYIKSKMQGVITVTGDENILPDVEDFNVEDGFADYFVITWTKEENCNYEIQWIDSDFETGSIIVTRETAGYSEYEEDGKTKIKFIHNAPSGVERIYTLSASKGVPVTKTLEEKKTLGTAQIEFNEYHYDSIVVYWNAVSMAEEYEVHAHYADNATELVTEENFSLEYNSETGKYCCSIEKPAGYNDALLSGKVIELSVTAKNSKAQTVSKKNVFTIGPALLNVRSGVTYADKIEIKWNAMEGAEGYRVIRKVTDSANIPTEYYVAAGNEWESDGKECKVVLLNGVYTLTDFYKENDDENLVGDQTFIKWGKRFEYTVVPVLKKEGSAEWDKNPEYSRSTPVYNATFGYGLNVYARKSESSSRQTVTWDAPYYSNGIPSLYRRKWNEKENSWQYVQTCAKGSTSVTYSPKDNELTQAYEYAVVYNSASEKISLCDSFVELMEKKMDEDAVYAEKSLKAEPLNKGYLLAVNLSAAYGGTMLENGTYAQDENLYSEEVMWSLWNHDERSIGPDEIELYIKNYNISKSWTRIALLDGDGHFVKSDNVLNTTISNSNETLRLVPSHMVTSEDVAQGRCNTEGPLMVLRDPHHYYKAVLKRNKLSADIGADDKIFAFRPCNDVELARSALLALSFGFYWHDNGSGDYKNLGNKLGYGGKGSVPSGNGGSIDFTGMDLYEWPMDLWGKYHASYNANYYAPLQLMPGGKTQTFLSLKTVPGSNTEFRISGFSDNYIYMFLERNQLEISSVLTDCDLNFDAVLYFKVDSKSKIQISIKRNGIETELVNVDDSYIRKCWFPMQLDGDSVTRYLLNRSEFGWWFDEEDN